jgi:hypothetical protein
VPHAPLATADDGVVSRCGTLDPRAKTEAVRRIGEAPRQQSGGRE